MKLDLKRGKRHDTAVSIVVTWESRDGLVALNQSHSTLLPNNDPRRIPDVWRVMQRADADDSFQIVSNHRLRSAAENKIAKLFPNLILETDTMSATETKAPKSTKSKAAKGSDEARLSKAKAAQDKRIAKMAHRSNEQLTGLSPAQIKLLDKISDAHASGTGYIVKPAESVSVRALETRKLVVIDTDDISGVTVAKPVVVEAPATLPITTPVEAPAEAAKPAKAKGGKKAAKADKPAPATQAAPTQAPKSANGKATYDAWQLEDGRYFALLSGGKRSFPWQKKAKMVGTVEATSREEAREKAAKQYGTK